MRGAIDLAKRGTPVVGLITEAFWSEADYLSTGMGMPDVPRIKLPHPTAGIGTVAMQQLASDLVPVILRAWEGRL